MAEKKDFKDYLSEEEKNKKETEKQKIEKQKEKIYKEAERRRKNLEKEEIVRKIKSKLEDLKMDINLEDGKIINEIKQVIETHNITQEELTNILEKIDEILEVVEKKEILPKELIFTKKDYLEALKDAEKRKKLLKKLDDILDYTSKSLQPTDNLFLLAGYFLLTDKNLQIVHDNCIDVKENLEKLN